MKMQTFARWTGRAAALSPLALMLMLCGCESVAGSSPQTLVRLVDASYNAPALDAYVAATPIAVNIGPATVTAYAFLSPGAATVTLDSTGQHTPLVTLTGSFLAGQQHSIYLTDIGAGYQATLLTDQNAPGPAGYVSVRFLQQARNTGPVDVYLVTDGAKLSTAKPVVTGLAAGAVTAYINVPAGTYDVAVTPAGSGTASYTSTAMQLTGGQVRTMLIVDQQIQNAPPVNVIVANDLN